MFDAHCHVGFSADPKAFATLIQASDLQVLSATVTPDEYVELRGDLEHAPSVHLAAGLHPWWITDDEATTIEATDTLLSAIAETRFVGEIGLDFSPTHAQLARMQLLSCARALEACAFQGGKVITLHSVRATGELLDLLEDTRCADTCTCIMHWFSGTSDELQRAIKLGCFFSVGERMLATKRGRAYVHAIPQGRLLLETDLPVQTDTSAQNAPAHEAQIQSEFDGLTTSLANALDAILNLGSHHTCDSIEATARHILGERT